MKSPQTKSIVEYYTEGKATRTEVSKYVICMYDNNILCFDTTQYCRIITLLNDSVMPSLSMGQNYLHIDIGIIPKKL